MSKEYARQELEAAGFFAKDSDYNGGLGRAVMELMEVFSKQGHSGASAPAVVELFSKVALHQPLLPITGEEGEWYEVDSGTYQNKRCSALFTADELRPYYLDAIIWRTPKGMTYSGSAENGDQKILSRQFVKAFPFVPKTFVVDVLEEEVAPDDWKFTVKDPGQLQPAFEYYG